MSANVFLGFPSLCLSTICRPTIGSFQDYYRTRGVSSQDSEQSCCIYPLTSTRSRRCILGHNSRNAIKNTPPDIFDGRRVRTDRGGLEKDFVNSGIPIYLTVSFNCESAYPHSVEDYFRGEFLKLRIGFSPKLSWVTTSSQGSRGINFSYRLPLEGR